MLNINSNKLEERIIAHRRFLHANPEVGFDLNKTVEYVKSVLAEAGIEHRSFGRCGVVATVGKGKKRCILLRADMDALPIKENVCLEFSPKNGNMHGCGHDMHTAMLLGAAEILKSVEEQLSGCVKLMFQPAEELLLGAKDMIDAGVLEEPRVEAAVMLHVIPAAQLPIGTLVIPEGGEVAPAAVFFEINITGKSSHGANPEDGVSALSLAAELVSNIESSSVRGDDGILTVGSFNSGNAANVIPESAKISGTYRAFTDDIQKRADDIFKRMMNEIFAEVDATASVKYTASAPMLKINPDLARFASECLPQFLGDEGVYRTDSLGSESEIGGSEDFAYVSHRVPSLMLGIVATGDTSVSLHNPKIVFDEHCLIKGAVAYAAMAIEYMKRDCPK